VGGHGAGGAGGHFGGARVDVHGFAIVKAERHPIEASINHDIANCRRAMRPQAVIRRMCSVHAAECATLFPTKSQFAVIVMRSGILNNPTQS
jgi:hypothetical protein